MVLTVGEELFAVNKIYFGKALNSFILNFINEGSIVLPSVISPRGNMESTMEISPSWRAFRPIVGGPHKLLLIG